MSIVIFLCIAFLTADLTWRVGALFWADRDFWRTAWRVRRLKGPVILHVDLKRETDMNIESIPINCPGCGEGLIDVPTDIVLGDRATYMRINQMLHDAGALVVNETDDRGRTAVQSYHSTKCRNIFMARPPVTSSLGIYDEDDDS